jgi:hypothetical protein
MSHKFPDGNRKIINVPDPSKLLYPSLRLLDIKLDDNILPQIIAENLPDKSPNRSEYRRSFNRTLYNEEIGDMDELFNELLFAIKDLDVYARKLLSLQLLN